MALLTLAEILTERVALAVPESGTMGAYVARPAAEVPGRPGVVVCHELFGVTSHVREVCERLAATGLVAIAPDLYHRTAPGADLPHDAAGRDRGFELLHALDHAGAVADVVAALAWLRAGGARRVALLGLSLGGHVAYLAATATPVDAVVAFYPGWLTSTDIALSRPEPTLTRTAGLGAARVLVLSGEEDHAVPAADRDAIGAALRAAGVEHELASYPGTPHGFACSRRDTFAPEAAQDAWRRVDALFADVLTPPGDR